MPSLNYMPSMNGPLKNETKFFTIRKYRQDIWEGCRLVHFTGLRTSKVKRLFENTCTQWVWVCIYQDANVGLALPYQPERFFVPVKQSKLSHFAMMDGFESFAECFLAHAKMNNLDNARMLINFSQYDMYKFLTTGAQLHRCRLKA